MALTKSRRAPTRETALQLLMKTADIDDFKDLIRQARKDISATFAELCHIQSGERGDKTVAYTQKTHWSLLDLFGHHEGMIFMLGQSLAEALWRIESLERELKATKSLQTKSLDHFSLEDLEVEQIDDRNIKIALVRGDKEAAFNLKFPVVVHRGVWNERAIYERGDGVSHGGSWWIASKDNPGVPGHGDWRLAVKRGRDGKDVRA